MKKRPDFIWLLPILFFIFFSMYVTIRFIFILFFRAAFEPQVLFELTPFFLFSGVNNIQLLFASYIILCIDTILHLFETKRRLLYTYLPTSIMLAGLVASILVHEFNITYAINYVLFGLLLAILLIDHNRMLLLSKTPKPEKRVSFKKQEPHGIESPADTPQPENIPQPSPLPLGMLKDVIEVFLQQLQTMVTSIEHIATKIDGLENGVRETGNAITAQQQKISDRLLYLLTKDDEKNTVDTPAQSQEYPIKPTDLVLIIKRGIIKQTNRLFAEFLGYLPEDIVNKNLFDFIAPEALLTVQDFYLHKLEGVEIHSFETILITSDLRQMPVEITMINTIHAGENVYLAIVRPLQQRYSIHEINTDTVLVPNASI